MALWIGPMSSFNTKTSTLLIYWEEVYMRRRRTQGRGVYKQTMWALTSGVNDKVCVVMWLLSKKSRGDHAHAATSTHTCNMPLDLEFTLTQGSAG